MSVLYLFDIDGTLLHAHGTGRVAFDAVFEAHHAIPGASAGIRYGGKTDPAIVTELYEARLGRAPTAEEIEAFLAAYLPRLRSLLAAHGVEVIAGVEAALAYLRARPEVILGIATGNVAAGAAAKLEAAGLAGWFDLGGYGSDSHLRAELVARAIDRARALRAVREVVVVGDTVHDIRAARACGATACAVATGADPPTALVEADVVLTSLAALPAWHEARYAE